MRWVHRREARLLAAFERASAKRADLTSFVSEAEAAMFRARTGLGNIRALSNGIDLEHFRADADFSPLSAETRGEGPLILFTGQMDYPPNVDAVHWFAADVLPLVPRAQFVIAGRNPCAAVRALAGGRVRVTGAVADMRAWLAAADLVVAPLRIARGIQNKVLEAMAMTRAVVASPAAFEGIDAQAGHDLIVADGGEAMAAALRGLLEDPARAAAMAANARRCVERRYAWDQRLAPLGEMLFPAGAKAAA